MSPTYEAAIPLPVGKEGKEGVPVPVVLNVAVTLLAAVMDTVHAPLEFVHAPDHPTKLDPDAADAVSVIDVPVFTVSLQSLPQFIPVPVTVPVPVPDLLTVKA